MFDNKMKRNTETRAPSTMTANVFRIIGTLSVIYGILCLFLYIANTDVRTHGGRDISAILIYTAYCIPVGIGMLFLRRIFALMIALPCLAAGLWLGVGSIFKVLFPWMLINIPFGLVLCIPAYLTVKAWKELK